MERNPNTAADAPSDDPRDYDLPKTVVPDLPSPADLPDDVSPEQLPDEITIQSYADHPGENTASALIEMFGDTARNRALVIFLRHRGTDLHPGELTARADIPAENAAGVIEALVDDGLIRRTRVEDGIPFYEANQLNQTVRSMYGLERRSISPQTPSTSPA